MDNPKISVIIPVYNTEEYVAQAVESIMQQTWEDIEIILINDGSTDGSMPIMEKLAQKDRRIQLYSQKNQGQSVARNHGMQYASGTYVYFMDSDDLLEPEALEVCVGTCEANELDFVFFDARILQSDTQTHIDLHYHRTEATNERHVYTGPEVLNALLSHRVYSASPCLSVIRTTFLKSIPLDFYPGIIHEDELFTCKLYLHAQRVMGIHRVFFIRRIRPNSTMTQRFQWKNMQGYLTVAEEISKLRKKANDPIKKTIDTFLTQMLNAAIWKGHLLSETKRIYLFYVCITKYRRYVTARTLITLLLKPYIPNKKK